MKSLITGAPGFVGRYLYKLLADSGRAVFAARLPHEKWEQGDSYILDLLDTDSIERTLLETKPDVVYHLAAQSSVGLSWNDINFTYRVNCEGTVNLLSKIRELGLDSRVLLIGSGEEYGRVDRNAVPITEKTILAPCNPYAVSKASQTMTGCMFAEAFGMDIVMTRSFNSIGAGQASGFVVPDFCKQIADIEAGRIPPVISVGNLSAFRDFSDVRDVVRAYRALSEHGKKGEIYNVGSGTAVSIQSILDILLSMAAVDIEVVQDPKRMRPSDNPHIEADITKITECTGWKPETDLRDSLQSVLEYWRNR
ncbi:MAG: GDP-mannose 4,6-dehydratase [Oscillospiraceae bacterium]|nr:GDP-mannose 4,6-dehydratase [Oscillospiraceae bacterium]